MAFAPGLSALAESSGSGPSPFYVRGSNTNLTSLCGGFGMAQYQAHERLSQGESNVTIYLNKSHADAFKTSDFYVNDNGRKWWTDDTIDMYYPSYAFNLNGLNFQTRQNSGSKDYMKLSVDKSANITIRNGSIYTNDITVNGRLHLEGVKFFGRKTTSDSANETITLRVPKDGELWIYDDCSFDKHVNLVIEEGGIVRIYGTGNTLEGDFTNAGALNGLGDITVFGLVKNQSSGRITTGTFKSMVENSGTIHQYTNKTTFDAPVVNYSGGVITGGTFNKGVSNAKGGVIERRATRSTATSPSSTAMSPTSAPSTSGRSTPTSSTTRTQPLPAEPMPGA